MSFIIENGVLEKYIPFGETYIVIPDDVTSIGNGAFKDCSNLRSVKIPDSVTSIGKYAFFQCFSLQSINIPDTVTSIGNYAFFHCINLQSITISSGVTSVGNYAFFQCIDLQSVKIPNSVTSIGNCAFAHCRNLQSIEIPHSVTSIGRYAFAYCSDLQSIAIPAGVTKIESYAFAYCSNLCSITIPNGVKSIFDHAFAYCSDLRSIMIPESVKFIFEYAFYNCRFKSITLPVGVTHIEKAAFELVKITFNSKNFHISLFLNGCWDDFDSDVYYDVYEKEDWVECAYDEVNLIWFYNHPTFDNFGRIKQASYKNPMALLRFFAHHEDEYRDYIKENIIEIVSDLIYENNYKLINLILAENFITKNNIDKLINHAEEEHAEIASLLREHKNKHFGDASNKKEV